MRRPADGCSGITSSRGRRTSGLAVRTAVWYSRELTKVKNADLRWVQGDVRPMHREMVAAANGKNVWIAGGGELAGQFYDAGLLDELILQIAAVTLCRGLPLLPRKIVSPPLELTKVATFGKAFVELRYDVPKS
ncbi:MAG: dihydrofolate reductase family protein [Planctomycetota bacterium]